MSEALDDFPEWWFPCPTYLELEYEKRRKLGARRMAQGTAVFCGLARDVVEALPSVTARIERAGSMFGDYRVVIYENDSVDGTLDALRGWQKRNDRVDVISENLGSPRWEQVRHAERMAHMARCRNRYLEHVRAHYSELDFAIVLDTDLPRGFSYDGLENTFGYDGWHVVGANGISAASKAEAEGEPMFFDAWAFRREGDDAPLPFEEVNRIQFRRGAPPVPVWSSFGGVAVYLMEGLLTSAHYGGDDCEHVVLHRRLREQGFAHQYLNPSQIALY